MNCGGTLLLWYVEDPAREGDGLIQFTVVPEETTAGRWLLTTPKLAIWFGPAAMTATATVRLFWPTSTVLLKR